MERSTSYLLFWLVSLQPGHTEGVSPSATLVIKPNRPQQLLESEFVSLSCEVKNTLSEWKLRWATVKDEEESACPRGWISEAEPTCSTRSIELWDRGVYWCESHSGQHSNALNITINRKPSSALSVLPHRWPYEGDSVTLTCEVKDASLNWTFLWYRAVPYRIASYGKNSPDIRYRSKGYSVELLTDSSRGAGGSYTLSPAALRHTGLYMCRAEGGEPTYHTHYSNVEGLWVTGVSPLASLVISPNRSPLIESESVSLSCEAKDNSTGWRLRWDTSGERSDCPDYWSLEAGPTCNIRYLKYDDLGVYWCESAAGQHSNAVNITWNRKPSATLRVSPHSWPIEGESVTLSCEVSDRNINWTFLWYKAVPVRRTGPFRSESSDITHNALPYSVELLSDSSRGARGSYTLSLAAPKHTGIYVCRGEGGDPPYHTHYSYTKALWVTGVSPPASLVIRPNQTQLFESESLSLSCEAKDNSTGWRLRWDTDKEDEPFCPFDWVSETGPTSCTTFTSIWDSGVYWCESETGQYSNAVNITIKWRPIPKLRISPHHWPAEGDSVTLTCEVRDTSLNWIFSWYKAVTYRGSPYVPYRHNLYTVELLSDSSRGAGGSYTLSPAALKHTGLYMCRGEGGDPPYQTELSEVEFLLVRGGYPTASLVIRPNRTQVFKSESLSLCCEVKDNSTGWKLRWYTERGENSVCPFGWRAEAGPTCSVRHIQQMDAGVYWCESESGQYSNAVRIAKDSCHSSNISQLNMRCGDKDRRSPFTIDIML